MSRLASSGPTAMANSPATATVRKEVEEVSLTLSVTDKRGRPVLGLTPDRFLVLDDKRPVNQLLWFHPLEGLRLRVGMLMDWSDSVEDRMGFEQEAGTDFLREVLQPDYDEAFVISIGTRPELTQPLTSDPERIRAGLHPSRPGRLTSLYDAIADACNGEMPKETPGSPVRRALLVISDGEDTHSVIRLSEAIQAAQRSDVAIYTITRHGPRKAGGYDEGDKVLRGLAEQTGGRAFVVRSSQQLMAAIGEIQRDLRSGYSLSYKPLQMDRDGRFRTVQVVTRDRKFRVSVRRGYFAPKD